MVIKVIVVTMVIMVNIVISILNCQVTSVKSSKGIITHQSHISQVC